MDHILGHTFDSPPGSDHLTVEAYAGQIMALAGDEPTDPYETRQLGELVTDALKSLVLARRLVAAVQLLRHSGELDSVVAFFLIDTFTTFGVGELAKKDPVLESTDRRMNEIAVAHGDDPDFDAAASPEWLANRDEWDRRAGELQLQLLHAFGEPEMAAMRELRPDEFRVRSDEGGARLRKQRESRSAARRN